MRIIWIIIETTAHSQIMWFETQVVQEIMTQFPSFVSSDPTKYILSLKISNDGLPSLDLPSTQGVYEAWKHK